MTTNVASRDLLASESLAFSKTRHGSNSWHAVSVRFSEIQAIENAETQEGTYRNATGWKSQANCARLLLRDGREIVLYMQYAEAVAAWEHYLLGRADG